MPTQGFVHLASGQPLRAGGSDGFEEAIRHGVTQGTPEDKGGGSTGIAPQSPCGPEMGHVYEPSPVEKGVGDGQAEYLGRVSGNHGT